MSAYTYKDGNGEWLTMEREGVDFQDRMPLDDLIRELHFKRMDIPKEFRDNAKIDIRVDDSEIVMLDVTWVRPASEEEIAIASKSQERLAAYRREQDLKNLARLKAEYEGKP